MPAVAKVNNDVQKAIGELNDQRVVFADCGAAFLDAAGEVRERLMPDRLHPNAEGFGRWRTAEERRVVAGVDAFCSAMRAGGVGTMAPSTGGGGGEGSPPSSRSSAGRRPSRAACRTQLSSTRHELEHSLLNKWASLR